jgi:hypothetical protein
VCKQMRNRGSNRVTFIRLASTEAAKGPEFGAFGCRMAYIPTFDFLNMRAAA